MEDNITPVIEINNLHKSFLTGFWRKKVDVLNGVNIEVYPGETFGLLGPNGAGKTTSLKILVGLLKASRGQVKIFGQSPQNPKLRTRIGFLPEHPSVYAYLTGEEFLKLCGKFFNLSRSQIHHRIPELLSKVGLDHKAARKQIRTYSKGMMQRLGFAQALINDPDLLLLDEPMSGLDPMGRYDVKELILHLKEQGKTILFNSHILSDVEAICDRVGILVDGHIVTEGTINELARPLDNVYQLIVKGLKSTGKNNLKRLCLRAEELEEDKFETTYNSLEAALKAVAVARQSGGVLVELRTHRRSLEELFVTLVSEARDNAERIHTP